jgi:hypothetical protein
MLGGAGRRPEMRPAIAEQSASRITDVRVRLTKVTEALDVVRERLVRSSEGESETNQAGLATRLSAAAIDRPGLYLVASSVIASVIPFVYGGTLRSRLRLCAACSGSSSPAGSSLPSGPRPDRPQVCVSSQSRHARRIPVTLPSGWLSSGASLLMSLLPAGLGYFAMVRDSHRRAWARPHDRNLGDVTRWTAKPRAQAPGPTRAASRADS